MDLSTIQLIYWMDHPITGDIPTSNSSEITSTGTNWGQDLQTGNDIIERTDSLELTRVTK